MRNKTSNPYDDRSTDPADANLHAAGKRAIHPYLPPTANDAPAEQSAGNLFFVNPNTDTETLLANASENLESANQMAATLAFDLDDPHRAIVLGIQQLIDLSALLVDRAQEQVAPAITMATV